MGTMNVNVRHRISEIFWESMKDIQMFASGQTFCSPVRANLLAQLKVSLMRLSDLHRLYTGCLLTLACRYSGTVPESR